MLDEDDQDEIIEYFVLRNLIAGGPGRVGRI
jgi:hypothetical protein